MGLSMPIIPDARFVEGTGDCGFAHWSKRSERLLLRPSRGTRETADPWAGAGGTTNQGAKVVGGADLL